MNIILIFTYGVSLKQWDEDSLLDREILLYKKLIDKYGLNFTFITFGTEEDEFYNKLYNNIKIIPVYKHIKKSKYKLIDLVNVMLFSRKLKLLISNPSIIKTNQLTGSVLGVFLKWIFKVPLIVRTGYNLFDFSKYEKRRVAVRLLYFILTQVSLLFSDTYLVTSFVDKNSLERKFFTKKNIKVFPNWVEKINQNTSAPRYSKGVLSVGRLEVQKNYSQLINLISNSDFKLTIIGKGSLENELKLMSKSLNVNLEIIEKIRFNEINSIYQKFKIFISSSSFEGNPKVVLEAMANGCLVIARNNINNREIIVQNENGILYSDEDNLKELIKFYLENEEKRLEIINNAFKYIIKNNTLDHLCKREYQEYLMLSKS